MQWYGVRTIVESVPGTYEERITIWRTESFDDAIAQAEDDAVDYTEAVGGAYVGLAQAYLIGENAPGHGDEVYSLMRDSDLPPQEYVTTFFDTGAERQGGAVQP